MGWSRFGLLIFLLLGVSVRGQQSPTTTTTQIATRDPQALNVMNLALTAAGGVAAIKSITDYTAIGTISSEGQPAQDSVTISGRGASELRKDVAQSAGTSSSVISDVLTTSKDPRGDMETRTMQPPMMTGNFAMPYRELATVFSNSQFSLTYIGLTQVGSQSLHHIQTQFTHPGQYDPNGSMRLYHTVDFFIDSSTFQLCMVDDIVPRHGWPRTITYADFRAVNGMLFPFQIDEVVGNRPTSTIQLSQISLNTGLPDSTFQLGTAAQ
jgi:hypothetical protein